MNKSSPNSEDVLQANIALHTSMAKVYNEREPHFRPENRKRVREVLEAIQRETQGQRLLDLGCGTGFIIDLAKDIFGEIHGVDITAAMLAEIDTSGGNINLHNRRCEDLPFPDNHFDVATAYSFIDHTPNYRDILSEACRVLRPGAVMYLDLIPNRAFWAAVAGIDTHDDEPISPHVQKEINAVLHQHGEVEQEFNLPDGTFALAEPSKSDVKGMDGGEFRKSALELGFRSAEVIPQWYVGQGPVVHEWGDEEAELVNRYLRETLPMSLMMFKYLRIFLRK